jgi:small subunit ribosomal protein S6
VFIARQDMTPAQIESLTGDMSAIITKEGGKITKTEHWGVRALATYINKNKRGHYILLNIDSPPAAVQEMERNMRIHDDVLRYLTIRVDELEEGPSAVLRKSSDDAREGAIGGDRGDRRGGDRDRGMRPRLSNSGPRPERRPEGDAA